MIGVSRLETWTMTFPFERKRNLLVPWYLMASYAYYIRDTSIMSDGEYDSLCARLDRQWDCVEHRHKNLIDRDWLLAGTCFLRREQYPTITKSAACGLADIAFEDADLPALGVLGACRQLAFAVDGLTGVLHAHRVA